MVHMQKAIENVDDNVAVNADADNFDTGAGAVANSYVDVNLWCIEIGRSSGRITHSGPPEHNRPGINATYM